MTVPQVRDRSKTVTRRREDSWVDLKPGDRLILVEKAQGLRKGERQVVLTEAEVVDVRVEPLHLVDDDECAAEGFPGMAPHEFVRMWLDGNGLRWLVSPDAIRAVRCRRIEWRYLDGQPGWEGLCGKRGPDGARCEFVEGHTSGCGVWEMD